MLLSRELFSAIILIANKLLFFVLLLVLNVVEFVAVKGLGELLHVLVDVRWHGVEVPQDHALVRRRVVLLHDDGQLVVVGRRDLVHVLQGPRQDA